MKTDNPHDDSGPAKSKYYSEADGGVYYLYRFTSLVSPRQ
jgi:hypothetical protein